jgi:hypothetical protein
MHLSSWRPNWIVEAITSRVRIHHPPGRTSAVLALMLFVLYWIVPGFLAAVDGTLIDPLIVNSGVNRLSQMVGFEFWDISVNRNQTATLLYYTSDSTHFLFTLCLVVGVYLGNTLFDRIENFSNDLRGAGCHVAHENDVAIRALYRKCRSLFRSPSWLSLSLPRIGVRIAAAVTAIGVFVFFHRLGRQSCVGELICWWGQAGYGLAGMYYSFAIAGLVYLAAESLVAVLMGASMINLILRGHYAKPNLFAQDLANGMSPVGDFVLLSVMISFVGSSAVLIVLRLGYFGVENLSVVWALIIIATLFVPLATLIPMYSAISLIFDAKCAILQNVNFVFDSGDAEKTTLDPGAEWIKNIQPAISVYKHVSDLNVFPFTRHKASMSAITLVFVAAQTTYNFIKLFQ